MDARELRKEVGQRPAEELLERVLDELAKTQARLRRVEAENDRLRKRLTQYEPEVAKEQPPSPAADNKGAKFSVELEEQRGWLRSERSGAPSLILPTAPGATGEWSARAEWRANVARQPDCNHCPAGIARDGQAAGGDRRMTGSSCLQAISESGEWQARQAIRLGAPLRSDPSHPAELPGGHRRDLPGQETGSPVVRFRARPARPALEEGYEVFVVTDASGTFNQTTREAAWSRMAAAGAQLMTWFGVACELHRDWRNDIEGLGALFSNHLPAYRNLITSYNAKR